MTPLNKTVRRLTVDEYGYGRNRRKLVVALEKGDLITLREHGCRTRHTVRLWDIIGECSDAKLTKSAWKNSASGSTIRRRDDAHSQNVPSRFAKNICDFPHAVSRILAKIFDVSLFVV